MFSPEDLFIRNLDRLKAVLKQPSADGLLESAALLRQLLLDENPLLHQVNREVRIKISFLVNRSPAYPPGLEPDIEIIADGIAPSLARIPSPQEVNLDGLFRQTVLKINGQSATIRDVVQYVANYAGAVHKSTPDTPLTKSLEAVGQSLQLLGAPSVLTSLRGIIDIVVRGCQPLYIAIKAKEPG
jgi:hypothetical protein